MDDDGDEELPQGGVVINCEECENHWATQGRKARIYLGKKAGRGILRLSDKARFFFVDDEGKRQEVRLDLSGATVSRGSWYVIDGWVLRAKPASPATLHTFPIVEGDEAVLRFEHGLASVDVRLDRSLEEDVSIPLGEEWAPLEEAWPSLEEEWEPSVEEPEPSVEEPVADYE